jgi:signal transduction histidine kinase/ligand-binding sensor domain-containing protein
MPDQIRLMLLFAVTLFAGLSAHASTSPIHPVAHTTWVAQDGAPGRARRLLHADSAPPADRAVSQYQHDRWTTTDGLRNHAIDWIQQSPDGYLWLGTEGGLVRFDGVRFTPVDGNNTPALRATALYPTVPLHVDRQGVLWFATTRGLVRYKDGAFTGAAASATPSLSSNSRMAEDRVGRLWVWEQDIDGRLYEVRNGRLVTPDPQSGLPAHVTAAAGDPRGGLWLATVDRLLLRMDEAKAVSVLPSAAMPGGVVTMYVARNGVLWVGAQHGFGRLEHGRFEFHHLGVGGLNGYVSAFAEDAAGDVWIGTVGMGVLRWHAGRLERFDRRDGLSRDQVTSLLVDREGSVWIGTRGGLDRLRRGAVATFTPRNGGPPFSDPGALVLDRQGRFVVAGATTGLVAGRPGAWAPLPGAEAAVRRKIWTIAQGKRGIWVGGDDTLRLYGDGAAVQAYTARDGLAGKWMLAVAEDSLENVWVGTNQGLFRLTRGRGHTFSALNGLPNAYVRALLVDRRGAVWAGTNGGVARVVDDSLTSWGPAEGLAGPMVFTIRESQDGAIWIGTSGGLTRVRDGRLASVRAEQGLPGEMVFAIAEADSDLWIDTGSGISRMPLSELNAVADGRATRVHATTFGTRDGLPATEVVAGAQPLSARTPDGRLWFSTAAGLAVIDPHNLGEKDVPLEVLLETVRVDGREMAAPDLTAIPAGSSAVEIDYTATALSFPERIQFRYQLDGVDPTWREVGTRRRAYYTDLGPGSYHFRVNARNGDENWTENATLSFRVLPAWYQTLWFRALAVLMIGSLGGLMVAVVQRRRHARAQADLKRQYEITLAERARVAEDLHDTLLQGFAGVNLQLIAAELAIPSQPEVAAATLVRVQRLTEESLREARERVWEMRDAALASDDLATTLETIARDRSAGTPMEVEVATTGNSRRLPPSLLDASFRIGREAIVNAVRHAEASRIEIRLDFRASTFYLEVRDNGRGVSPNEAAEAQRRGHFGLTSIQNRAALMGGRCEVRPRQGGGTIVRLELPLVQAMSNNGR